MGGRASKLAAAAAIVLLAAALRLPALGLRPMHADEAVHAAKFGRLLEQGRYEYDPHEYHGPSLYYFTLIPARIHRIARFADLDERLLRCVPAVFGLLLVAAHLLLAPLVGFRAAALGACLAAVSPALVFYSRYYIQETPLTALGLGVLVALCHYRRRPSAGWAVAAGALAGLMFATKETWVIAAAAMAAAWFLASGLGLPPAAPPVPGRRLVLHGAWAALAFAVVSALLFSSFLQHPAGLVHAVTAYDTYLQRAVGTATWHVHPWYYYLGLLLFSGGQGAPVWTEGAILALGTVGLAAAVSRTRAGAPDARGLVFLSAYAVLMILAYSAIPYKTPWCVLGFLDAFAVLGGVGASDLLDRARPAAKPVVAACLAAAVLHLGWLAWAGSRPFASDPRNGWVYAHTGTGVFQVAARVEALARVHPDGDRMPIEIISGQNLWPLPWYLRRFPGARWETAPVHDGVHAPVILATPDVEPAIVTKLYEWRPPGERELYVPIFDHPVELRPRVEVRGYAAKSLWDRVEGQ
jgi:uncharacterized protein (TIGR03663 family)